jgi:hypothetical protein
VLLGFANYFNSTGLFLGFLLAGKFGIPLCKLTFDFRIGKLFTLKISEIIAELLPLKGRYLLVIEQQHWCNNILILWSEMYSFPIYFIALFNFAKLFSTSKISIFFILHDVFASYFEVR